MDTDIQKSPWKVQDRKILVSPPLPGKKGSRVPSYTVLPLPRRPCVGVVRLGSAFLEAHPFLCGGGGPDDLP